MNAFQINALLLAAAISVDAQIVIPSDGSDGVFNPQADIEIDLGAAVNGQWDANNSANAGKGIYDPEKWAVVFKYSSVNIPAGVKVTFKNHPSRPPVVWLVNGNVTIAGEVNLDGRLGDDLNEGEPGPGGFRGGNRAFTSVTAGHGFGPGGGRGFPSLEKAGAGAYATRGGGGSNGPTYGNSELIPLIGGSGGTSPGSGSSSTGSGGGGAILLAATRTLTINGEISASAANIGSGGGIRVIAETIAGNGIIDARGGPGQVLITTGVGRVSMQSTTYSASLQTYGIGGFTTLNGDPQIWPAANAPFTRIVSIDGILAPDDPKSSLAPPTPDLNFNSDVSVPVVIETRNLPVNSTVTLRVVYKNRSSQSVNAVFQAGNESSATWLASINSPQGYSALQVRVVGP